MTSYKDKVTKGRADVVSPDGYPVVRVVGVDESGRRRTSFVSESYCGKDDNEANTTLFAEAINVLHETNLTPRELAEQRAELLEAMKGIEDLGSDGEHSGDRHAKCREMARAAIAKCEGTKP